MGRTKSNPGHCAACGQQLVGTRAAIAKHLDGCDKTAARLAKMDEASKARFFRIYIRSRSGQYWLMLDVKADAILHDLDGFLRDIWLECCGHLSCFTIDGMHYQSDDEMVQNSWSGMDKPMSTKLFEVFAIGTIAEHIYDFGSSTYLQLVVESIRSGPLRKDAVLMLARNAPIKQICEECGNAPATLFCPQCQWDAGDGFFCNACHDARECEEGNDVCNSPRMGVCGYEGPAEWFRAGAVSPVPST